MGSDSSAVSLGEFLLDPSRGLLLRDGHPVHVRPKTYALLLHLAGQRGRVVSKDELLDAVWPGVTVTEDTLTQTMRDLRRVLGPVAAELIVTYPRRGYMLAASGPAPALPRQPGRREIRLAVIPFAVDGAPGDEALFRDLAEEIAHGLGRFRSFAVIAPQSALSPDAPPLHVDYRVSGRVRRQPGRYRVSLSLIGAADGRILWEETLTLVPDDLPVLGEAVPMRVVPRIAANAEEAAGTIAPLRGTRDFGAFVHFVRARRALRDYRRESNLAARDELTAALRLDPGFALARAYLALTEMVIADYSAAPREVLDQALQLASEAAGAEPEDSRCHRIVGLARLFRCELALAEEATRRAISLNPYDADALAQLCYILAKRGRGEEGLAAMARAMELNPLHPEWYHLDAAVAAYAAGRYAESAERLLRIPSASPMRETRLAAAVAMAGEPERAARHLAAAEALSPGWDPVAEASLLPFETDALREQFLEGLRRAQSGASM